MNRVPIEYPRGLTSVHQIELTNHCNLKCVYCMQPRQKREKIFIDFETFKKSIAIAKHCHEQGTQTELWLHGLGEPVLHPEFYKLVEYARTELPMTKLMMSTNAILLTEEHCKFLFEQRIIIHISIHKPEKSVHGVQLASKYKIVEEISANAALRPNDWAGQLEWVRSVDQNQCGWLKNGWIYIMSNGDIVNCCVDVLGTNILGTVDNWKNLEIQPYKLCESCNLYP